MKQEKKQQPTKPQPNRPTFCQELANSNVGREMNSHDWSLPATPTTSHPDQAAVHFEEFSRFAKL